jgi:hypothetical protein
MSYRQQPSQALPFTAKVLTAPAPHLQSRVKEDRRKRWDEAQRVALTAASAALAAFDKASGPASKLTELAKRQRSELEGRVNYLKELQKGYEDFGEKGAFVRSSSVLVGN